MAAADFNPSFILPGVRREWAILSGLTLLCLLLPTQNSTPDAWYYAACVRHGHELLLPHHLLHNVVGWLWMKALPSPTDTLAALKALNALAYGAVLLVLRDLLRRVGGPAAPVAAWLLVVGSSFGMLRFATENETYILPLLLSLLASRSAWRAAAGETGRRGWLAAGAWAAGAALLHQIHAGWGLGLGLSIVLLKADSAAAGGTGAAGLAGLAGRRWRAGGLYALPILLAVPLAYAAALPGWQLPLTASNLWHFVFRDLYAGQAGAVPSAFTLLLTGISFGRTFGQVHGSGLALLRPYPALAGVGVLCLGMGMVALGQLWRAGRGRQPAAWAAQAARPAGPAGWFGRTHRLILALQLACALWAAGNAEFMVMVPALLALLLVRRPWPARPLYLAGVALLLWNLAFGLLPAHQLRLTADMAPLLARIGREPAAYFLLTDPNLVLNQLHYRTGQAVGPATVLPAPARMAGRPAWSVGRFRAWLAARRAAGQRVYTDALGGARLLDRARLTRPTDAPGQAALLAGYQLVRVDSLPTSLGMTYLTEIR